MAAALVVAGLLGSSAWALTAAFTMPPRGSIPVSAVLPHWPVATTTDGAWQFTTDTGQNVEVRKDSLAAGSQAEVHRGWIKSTKTAVAVKIFNDPDEQKKEADKMVAMGEYKAVIHYIDKGTSPAGRKFVIYELARESLRDALQNEIQQPLAERVGWARDILAATQFIRLNLVRHGDFIAPNVLLVRERIGKEQGCTRAKLADFGKWKKLETDDVVDVEAAIALSVSVIAKKEYAPDRLFSDDALRGVVEKQIDEAFKGHAKTGDAFKQFIRDYRQPPASNTTDDMWHNDTVMVERFNELAGDLLAQKGVCPAP
ncbi:protein kinase [Nonomuraea sp. NPDC001699]